jgi:hypothetical protein
VLGFVAVVVVVAVALAADLLWWMGLCRGLVRHLFAYLGYCSRLLFMETGIDFWLDFG